MIKPAWASACAGDFYFWRERSRLFFLSEIDRRMSRKCPTGVLFFVGEKWDNTGMDELMKALKKLGLPVREMKRIMAYYRDDPEGLRQYVLYMRIVLDDKHEYLD